MVARDSVARRWRITPARRKVVERAGISDAGRQFGKLVDGGFQKFFWRRMAARAPRLASELKAIHAFEEDLARSSGAGQPL